MTRSPLRYRVAGLAAGLAVAAVPLTVGAAESQAATTINETFDGGGLVMILTGRGGEPLHYSFINTYNQWFNCEISVTASNGSEFGVSPLTYVGANGSGQQVVASKTKYPFSPDTYTGHGWCHATRKVSIFTTEEITIVKKPFKFTVWPASPKGSSKSEMNQKIKNTISSKTIQGKLHTDICKVTNACIRVK